jgi:Inner membrane component of T3SS, cytoplasmic domain
MKSIAISPFLEWGVAIVVVIIIVALAIIFRKHLKQLLGSLIQSLQKIGVEIGGESFKIKFELDKLQELGRQLKDAGILQPGIGGETSTALKQEIKRRGLSARDAILESWGRLEQIIYAAAQSRGIALSPAMKAPEALERLVNANVLTRDLANPIIALYNAGKKIANYSGKRVSEQHAIVYQELAGRFLDWIMRNVIAPKKEDPPLPPRLTVVGEYFPPHVSGQPIALLVGVKGPMQGRQFPVEKELFRIGASSDNDLVIAGDDYVSGAHAHLRYDKGSLWLADQHSRNGTFLNGNRLKGAPTILNFGDRIRVGNSMFEVIRASSY